jgi:hypothetical protein
MKSDRRRELLRSDLSSGPLGRLTGARAVLWLHPSCEGALAMFDAVGAALDRWLSAKELHPVQQPAERPAAAPPLQVDQRNVAVIVRLHLVYPLPEAINRPDRYSSRGVFRSNYAGEGLRCLASARRRDAGLWQARITALKSTSGLLLHRSVGVLGQEFHYVIERLPMCEPTLLGPLGICRASGSRSLRHACSGTSTR